MAESILESLKSMNSNDFLLHKQIEIMIDGNNKKIAAEFNSMQAMIDRLSEELQDVKRKMNESRPRPEPVVMQQTEVRNVEPVPIISNSHPESPGFDIKKSRPRTGDYQPSDVAVDKFFYFGGNKR